MTAGTDSEFAFELRVCQWAERAWPPTGDRESAVLVARQLGVSRRRWDTIVLECDPEGLLQRAVFGPERLDSDLLHVVRHAPREFEFYQDALPDPGYPWRYVRETIHEADDRGVVETRRRGGRIELRRKWRYPDWLRRVVAIENKPDLDAAAARDLVAQVDRDVALGLADEVWVATASTDAQVEPALLERMPVEAGILLLDLSAGDADVAWHPRTLDVEAPGTRILANPTGRERDQSAGRFEYVDAGWKAAKRLEIAERAYERGWRAYADTMRPDCRQFSLATVGGDVMPYCEAKACHQTAAQCSGGCSDFEPEPPAWRQKGWPLEGGPGASIKRLLARRRDRERPGR